MSRRSRGRRRNGQYRTMLHYKATLNSFKRYRDNKDIALREIDAEVMRSYEAYLHHTAEVCKNTSSLYLRILRATYNKAEYKAERIEMMQAWADYLDTLADS